MTTFQYSEICSIYSIKAPSYEAPEKVKEFAKTSRLTQVFPFCILPPGFFPVSLTEHPSTELVTHSNFAFQLTSLQTTSGFQTLGT